MPSTNNIIDMGEEPLAQWERSQDALNPANMPEPHIRRELRLEATMNMCITRADWATDYSMEIDKDRPDERIGALLQTIASIRDDLEAAL